MRAKQEKPVKHLDIAKPSRRSFNDLPPEDVFDAMMRVLNEGLGDQVVKAPPIMAFLIALV